MSSVGPVAPTPPPPLGSPRVSEGVTSYLRDLILAGQLQGGAPLRVEHLAAQLDISVTPVRESLVELFAEGFVNRAARRGYKVAELTPADMRDIFVGASLLSGELAARACDHMDDQLVLELRQLNTALAKAEKAGDLSDLHDLNHAFHRCVNLAAQSRKLARMAQLPAHFVPRWSWELVEGLPAASVRGHRRITKALATGDPDQAREAMADHVVRSGELLVVHLSANGLWSAAGGQ